jgi:hypothetical protein
MIASLASTAVWLLLVISVVIIGWDEPLRYKFMSRAQIAAEERALLPPPPPAAKGPAHTDMRDWDGGGGLIPGFSPR